MRIFVATLLTMFAAAAFAGNLPSPAVLNLSISGTLSFPGPNGPSNAAAALAAMGGASASALSAETTRAQSAESVNAAAAALAQTTANAAMPNTQSALTALGGALTSSLGPLATLSTNFGNSTFTATGGTASQSLISHLNWILFTADYGVVPNNTTNNATNLQTAVTDAGSNVQPGNIVQLPSGIVSDTGTLSIPSNVGFTGTGRPAGGGNASTYLVGSNLRFNSTTTTAPAMTSPSGTGSAGNANAINFLNMGITSGSSTEYSYLGYLTNWESSIVLNTVWNSNGAPTVCLNAVNQNSNGGSTYPYAWVDKIALSDFKCGNGDLLSSVTDSVFLGDYYAGSNATGSPLPIVEIGGGDGRVIGNMVDNNPNGDCMLFTPLVSGAGGNVQAIVGNALQACGDAIVFSSGTSSFTFGDAAVGNIFSRNGGAQQADFVINNGSDITLVGNQQDSSSSSQDQMVQITGTGDYRTIVGNGTEYANWTFTCAAHDNVFANGTNPNCVAGPTTFDQGVTIDGAVSGPGVASLIAPYAPLASPALTGSPTAPTQTTGDTTTKIATDQFVQTAIAGISAAVTSFNSRTGAITLLASDLNALVQTLANGTTATTQTQGDTSSEVATDNFATNANTSGANFPYIPDENTGYWIFGAVNASGLGSLTPTTSRIYYVPFTEPSPASFTQLGIMVTTAQTGDSCNVGIYNSQTVASQTIPNALLISTGALSVGTVANIVSSAAAISLTGKGAVYWAGMICNSSSAVIRALPPAGIAPSLGLDPGASTYYQYFYTTGSGTTLPNSAPATPSSYNPGGAGNTSPAIVGLQ